MQILLQRVQTADRRTAAELIAAIRGLRPAAIDLAEEILDQSKVHVCAGTSPTVLDAAGRVLLERFPQGAGGVGHANRRLRAEMELAIPLIYVGLHGRIAQAASAEY